MLYDTRPVTDAREAQRLLRLREADRKAQFDAAMKVHALFGDESAVMDRILALRASLANSFAPAKLLLRSSCVSMKACLQEGIDER